MKIDALKVDVERLRRDREEAANSNAERRTQKMPSPIVERLAWKCTRARLQREKETCYNPI